MMSQSQQHHQRYHNAGSWALWWAGLIQHTPEPKVLIALCAEQSPWATLLIAPRHWGHWDTGTLGRWDNVANICGSGITTMLIR